MAHNQGWVRGTLVSHLADIAMPWTSAEVRPWLYVIASLCLVSLLAFIQLSQASLVSRQIDVMESLERDVLVLRQRQNLLRLQIAEYERMPRIKQEARALGLGEAQHIEYVRVPAVDAAATRAGGVQVRTEPPHTAMFVGLPAWLSSALRQFADWVGLAGLQPEPQASGAAG